MPDIPSVLLEEEKLAAEGYQFYAEEAAEFAIMCGLATLESWENLEQYWLSLGIDKDSPQLI